MKEFKAWEHFDGNHSWSSHPWVIHHRAGGYDLFCRDEYVQTFHSLEAAQEHVAAEIKRRYEIMKKIWAKKGE